MIFTCILMNGQSEYYIRLARLCQHEAEYYMKQAQGYEEVEYYNRQAQKHLREAEY